VACAGFKSGCAKLHKTKFGQPGISFATSNIVDEALHADSIIMNHKLILDAL